MNEDKQLTALGQLGNSILNGADMFASKIDDIGSLATGLILMPSEYLDKDMKSGEVTKYLNENDDIKRTLVTNIRDRREQIDKYAEQNPIKGSVVKIASGFAEQTVDPLQMGMNIMTQGFLPNAIQNISDYIYEETSIMGRQLSDFDTSDAINMGTGVALAGLTSKFETKDIAKPLYDDFTPSIEKMAKANKDNGGRVIDHQAAADIIARQDSGQTLSIPKGKNLSVDIEKTIDDGVIPGLRKLSNTLTDDQMNKGGKYQYKYSDAVKNTEGDALVKANIVRILKPIYTEVELGKDQALGEIAEDLSKYIYNKPYNEITPLTDIISNTIKDIQPDEFVRVIQGKSQNEKYKPLQDILRKYVNEYVSLKTGVDYSGKETGFLLETVYNKQYLMGEIRNILDDPQGSIAFVKGQMKDIGGKVYLSDDEAKNIGLIKSGIYNIEETPQLLKQLFYDINSTTKDVSKGNRKNTVKLSENTLFDIAYKWVDMDDKEKYLKLLNKKEKTQPELDFIKDFQNEMLGKFENLFKGHESDPREILERIFSTVVDERSGYNKVLEKFENFTTAYKANGEATKDIKWLDFTLNKGMARSFFGELDNLRSLSSYRDITPKKFEDLKLDGKMIKFMKDWSAWKLLFGLRHIREATPNTALVNSGANRLGFDSKYSFLKGNYEMAKIHYELAKSSNKAIKEGLSSISNPVERFEVEMYLKRILQNRYNFTGKSLSKGVEKLAEIGGNGQLISDVHRTAMAMRFTSKAMFEEFPKMKFENMTPEMRTVLKNSGIDELALQNIQNQIKGFKSYDAFNEFIMNSDIITGGKLKSIFEQFTDIMGREFEPYDKRFVSIDAKSPLTKLWLESNLLFRRYSMGAFSRAWNNVSTYYDANDILRNRLSNPRNILRNANFKGTKNNITNLAKMSMGLWLGTQSINYLHGKMFGTSGDDIIEAKYEAIKEGDILPIIADGVVDSITDYIGFDIMFGGSPAFFSILNSNYKTLQHAATSDNLTSSEKVLYGLASVLAPSNISRGIDNIKFGRTIPTKINTWSEEAQFQWKKHNRLNALHEQKDGELPIEKLVKESYQSISDWTSFFKKNPDKAYEVTNFDDEKVNKDIAVATASGLMEMAEQGIRQDHINFALSQDTVEEREQQLKDFGLDYKTQLKRLDPEIRDLFNYVMSFKQVEDPHYLLVALEEMTEAKNKKATLKSFLKNEELPLFDNYVRNIKNNIALKKKIARKGYPDNTDGYIEFLKELRANF